MSATKTNQVAAASSKCETIKAQVVAIADRGNGNYLVKLDKDVPVYYTSRETGERVRAPYSGVFFTAGRLAAMLRKLMPSFDAWLDSGGSALWNAQVDDSEILFDRRLSAEESEEKLREAKASARATAYALVDATLRGSAIEVLCELREAGDTYVNFEGETEEVELDHYNYSIVGFEPTAACVSYYAPYERKSVEDLFASLPRL